MRDLVFGPRHLLPVVSIILNLLTIFARTAPALQTDDRLARRIRSVVKLDAGKMWIGVSPSAKS